LYFQAVLILTTLEAFSSVLLPSLKKTRAMAEFAPGSIRGANCFDRSRIC